MYKNKVKSCLNDMCENVKVKTKKNKYPPEKVFEGYKKKGKGKVKKGKKVKKVKKTKTKTKKGGCGCGH